MKLGFIREPKTTLGHSLTLQSESCKREMAWPLLLLETDNPLLENGTIFPLIITPLLASCAVLYPLTMHVCRRVVVLPPCCLQIRSARFWLVGDIFWPVIKVHMFRDLSCLSGFCRVCSENFPAKKGVETTPYLEEHTTYILSSLFSPINPTPLPSRLVSP